MRSRHISALLDGILPETASPQRLLDQIVVRGTAMGLDWKDIVQAVDEAERRTGLAIHPTYARAG